MSANFMNAFRGPQRAEIDRAAYSNSLLKNEVSRIPQRNAAEDMAIQADQVTLSETQKQNAAGVLARNFTLAAQSPRPRDAARALVSSPEFQSAGQMLGLPVQQFTVTDQDTDDALRQQMQSWAQALGANNGAAMPAGVVEHQYMAQGLSPEEQAKSRRIALGLESRAGQGRVTMVNGVPTWTEMGADGQPMSVPLSSLQSESTAARTMKQEEALGSGRGQAQAAREASEPQRNERARQQIGIIDNVLSAVDAAAAKVDWNTTGFVGNALKDVAGTPAHDLQQQLLTIQANLGFDRIQQMRESSPTGGALGQVAVQELNALQASVAALAQSQSDQQFRDNLQKVKTHYTNWRNVITQAQGGNSGVPDFSSMTDADLMRIINGQ